MKAKGKCLCGSIELEVELSNTEVAACHCSMCRTWSGGPMLVIDSGELKKISNESGITRYPSSEWAERGFCTTCGTHLFYFLKPNNQYHFPAGLLDAESAYNFSHQIFIDEKPEYYQFSNETKNLTGEEVFAQFSGE
ncbi:MAG: GFA family protein [Pseudomonadales bacterium]|nr:GFA family protein [Pseudomonadales bacterium]